VATYRDLRAAGFDNLNLDLMFGLPGQTMEQWRATLCRAIELQPEHFSMYCLSLEEDTKFWRLFQAGQLRPDADLERAMYELAIDTLAAASYQQYEVSNFAKPGQECRHNIAGWEGHDYLGLGPSACSTVGDLRWQNIFNIGQYVTVKFGHEFEERLTPTLRAAERAAFGMRMTAGIPESMVRGRFDQQVAKLLSAEFVYWENGRLRLTRRGILFADEVSAEFV
jgi:oxygen-independent coproporphyrinogen-3 oxidase